MKSELYGNLLASMLDKLLLPLQGDNDPFPIITGLQFKTFKEQIIVDAKVGNEHTTAYYDMGGNFLREERKGMKEAK